MDNKRPVELNLLQLRFPFTAIISILHRISGVIIFLSIPVILYGFSYAFQSEINFIELKRILLSHYAFKIMVLGILLMFSYHTIAGIRHLIMDFGHFESQQSANISGFIVIMLNLLVACILGVYLFDLKEMLL